MPSEPARPAAGPGVIDPEIMHLLVDLGLAVHLEPTDPSERIASRPASDSVRLDVMTSLIGGSPLAMDDASVPIDGDGVPYTRRAKEGATWGGGPLLDGVRGGSHRTDGRCADAQSVEQRWPPSTASAAPLM